MKKSLFLFLCLVISCPVFSQSKANNMNVADSVLNRYTWDTQKVAQGTMMLLDVRYKRNGADSEDLTITVAKDRMHKRPAFISVIVPNNIVEANGILINFAKSYKDENGKWQTEPPKSDPIRVPFERCDNEKKICTARIQGGYLADPQTDEKIDIFQMFMGYSRVYFILYYPDGSHKSIAIPLDSFQEQYKAIEAADTPVWHE